jgi:competence protein ComEC
MLDEATARREVDPLLILAAAAAVGAPLALAPLPTAFGLVATALFLRSTVARALAVAALLLAAANGLRALHALESAGAAHREIAAALGPPQRCQVSARVARSPVLLRARDGPAPRRAPPGAARIDVVVESAVCARSNGDVLRGRTLRLYGAPDDLGRGDRVLLAADVGAAQIFVDPGLADARASLALGGVVASGGVAEASLLERGRGPPAWIDAARAHVRRRIEATFAADMAPLARALVLGETDLEAADRDAFRRSGLAHLLAVSGTHLVIAVVALVRAMRALLVRIRPLAERHDVGRAAAVLGAALAWVYADFAGGGGSAMRAAAMLCCGLLARALGRRPCALRAFAWSLLGGALAEPLALCDLSFVLSLCATGGLLLAQAPAQRLCRRRSAPLRAVLGSAAATLAATTACAPVLLATGPELPLLGIVANVIAAPIGELAALPVCLAHALLAWAPLCERGAAIVGGGALELVQVAAHVSAAAGGLALPPPTAWQLAAALVTAAACFGAASRRKVVLAVGAVALLVLELVARRAGSTPGRLRVTVLDVGQGDGLLLDMPDGRLVLVDGGGIPGAAVDLGDRVVLPVLRARRRGRIDVAVLTHPHPDHYGGFFSTLARVDVGEVWDGGLAHGGGEAARGLAVLAARGIPIRRPDDLCNRPRSFGDATIQVLAPCPAPHPERNVNDASLVLRVSLGDHVALLTGDAEAASEGDLVAEQGDRLRADFLKVGHHGSLTSTTAPFLAAVAPRVAAISCGVRNRFAHPRPGVVARLLGADALVLRTDRGGYVEWETDGAAMRWRQGGGPWQRP